MNRWLRGLLVVMTTVFLVACGSGNEEAASGEGGASEEPLLIGMEAAYPPYNWTQDTDENNAIPIQESEQFANGYDVQIASRVGEALGREVVAVKTDWNGIIPALQSGKADLIIAGMTPTPERSEVVQFSDPYYDVQFAMITRADSEYADATTLEDFEGARVTGQVGTLNYDLLDQIPGAEIHQAMDDFSAMRVALEAGRIDAYITEYPEAVSATNAIDALTYIVPEPSFEVPEGVAAHLAIGGRPDDTELIEQVNEVLAGISDEERQTLMDEAIANQPSEQ